MHRLTSRSIISPVQTVKHVGSSKSLVSASVLPANIPPPKTTSSFVAFRFEMEAEMEDSPAHVLGLRSYVLFTCCFFSYCDDNCISPNKPLPDVRMWLFGEGEASTCHL